MCVNKIRIKNNKIDVNPLVDRLYNYVPCGKCEECLKNRAQQYETRLVAEYEACKRNGGFTFFYTLTYDEQHVPLFCGERVFSKYDVQKYHKRLRKMLGKPFRYFLSSEYGHKTFRPHYHVVYFLNEYIDPKRFYECINDSWGLGNIMPGKNLGVVVSAIPMRYVAKYVDKDISSLREFNSKHFTRDKLVEYKEDKNTRYYNIDLLPFHLQSNGLGLSLALHLTDNDLINGYYISTDALGVSRQVSIPLYILRHTIYETYVNKNGNMSYRLNERGLKLFVSIKKTQYEREKLRFENDIDKFITYYNSIPILQKGFSNVEECKKFVSDFRSSHWSDWLSRYSIIYREYDKIKFSFRSVDDDLNILLKLETNPDNEDLIARFNPDDYGYDKYYIYADLDNFLLKCFECIYQYERYKLYVDNVNTYNLNQQFRSYKTHKDKSVPIKTFSEFINLSSVNEFYSNLSKRLNYAFI